jgi:VanZ family protein
MKKIADFKFTILIAALILVALLIPSSAIPKVPTFYGIDKAAHFILFFFFALSYILEFRRANHRLPSLLSSFFLVFFFMLASETLQLFTRSRHFELLDMAFDGAGATTAYVVMMIFLKTRKDSGKAE